MMVYDTSTENITDRLAFRSHILYVDDLRSHKAWSPAPDKNILFLVRLSSQPEVQDHHFSPSLLPEHYVLSLQIPMDNTLEG